MLKTKFLALKYLQIHIKNTEYELAFYEYYICQNGISKTLENCEITGICLD